MRFHLTALVADPIAFWAVAAVLGLTFITLAVLGWQYLNLRRRLETFAKDLPVRIAAWPEPAQRSAAVDPLWTRFQRVFLLRPNNEVIVVRESPAPGVQREIQKLAHTGVDGFIVKVFGEHLTAIALIVTFGLLGLVLVGDIHQALTHGSNGANSEALAQGLAKMGAKFFVSATGILGAWLAQVIATWTQRDLEHRVSDVVSLVEGSLQTLDAFQAREAIALREEVSRVRERLRELERIEVSVQGIGEQVTANIGLLVKEQAAQTIVDSIRELEAHVGDLAAGLETALRAQLTSQTGQLADGLQKVRLAVESQSASEVEKLLSQLGNVVSGGFQAQSQDMGRQLTQLAQVLPRLEAQFSAMADSLGQNAQTWGEQNSRAVAALSNQVAGLVSQFELARGGMDAAVNSLMDVSQRVLQGVGAAATQQAQTINREVQILRENAAADGADFERRTRAFGEMMEKTQVELATANRVIRDTSVALSTQLQQATDIQQAQRGAVEALNDAARTISVGTKSIEAVITRQPEILQREGQLIEAQRVAVDRVAVALDSMLKRYSETITHQAQLLADGWSKQAANIKQTVEGLSGNLQESVDDLGQALNDAIKTLKNGGTRA